MEGLKLGTIFMDLIMEYQTLGYAYMMIQLLGFQKIKKITFKEENDTTRWIKKQHFLQKELQSIAPSIDIFIDHIEYIIKLAGIDYVAIGSDYDGLDCLPKEMTDCRDHTKIIEKLEQRGYSEKDIEKVMGLNLLRVIEAVKN